MDSTCIREYVLPSEIVANANNISSGSKLHPSSNDNANHRRLLSSRAKPPLCAHALAVGSTICGIDNAHHVGSSSDDSQWLKWTVSLAPKTVASVVSTRSGSLVIASTVEGSVSLICGHDGKLIVTREFASASDSLQVSVVCNDNEDDNIVILIETSTMDGEVDVLLVSGITESALQDGNTASILSSVSISKLGLGCFEAMRSFFGYMRTSDTVCLLACNDDGCLTAIDYNLSSKSINEVATQPLSLQIQDSHWIVDYKAGFQLQHVRNKTYLLCSARSGSNNALFWIDGTSFSVSQHYIVPVHQNEHNLTIASFTPIVSYLPDNIGTIAVAFTSTDCTVIKVLQVMLEDTLGLVTLCDPQCLFSIDIDDKVEKVAVSPLATKEYVCAFNYGICSPKCTTVVYKSFIPDQQVVGRAGQVVTMVASAQFRQASTMLSDMLDSHVCCAKYIDVNLLDVHMQSIMQHITHQHDSEADNDELLKLAGGFMSKLMQDVRNDDLHAIELLRTFPSTLLSLRAKNTVSNEDSILNLLRYIEQEYTRLENHEGDMFSQSSWYCIAKDQLRMNILLLEYMQTLAFRQATNAISREEMASVTSPRCLLSILCQHGLFQDAEALCRSSLKAYLSIEDKVTALFQVTSDTKPVEYLSFVSEYIMKDVEAKSDLLVLVRAWACQLADRYDTDREVSYGLDDAIDLLMGIHDETKKVYVKVYTSRNAIQSESVSFSNLQQSSLNDSSNKTTTMTTKTTTGSNNTTIGSSHQSLASYIDRKPSLRTRRNGNLQPALLAQGSLTSGPFKIYNSNLSNLSSQIATESYFHEHSVEKKLHEASCLQLLRQLGFGNDGINLSNFGTNGGVQFCALNIATAVSKLWNDKDEANKQCQKFNDFCGAAKVSYDETILQCVTQICDDVNITTTSLEESAFIAQKCESQSSKSKAILPVLQAALLCKHLPCWISDTAEQAVVWSNCDTELQIEIKELSRLLRINAIITKYCGSEARNMFRIDNVQHSIRLLQYVLRNYIDRSVITDIQFLCLAFHHLSFQDAVCELLQHSMLQEKNENTVALFEDLLELDISVAAQVFPRLVTYVEELVSECHELKSAIQDGDTDLVLAQRDASASVSLIVELAGLYICHSSGVNHKECLSADASNNLAVVKKVYAKYNAKLQLQESYNVYLPCAKPSTSLIALTRSTKLCDDIQTAAACDSDDDLKLVTRMIQKLIATSLHASPTLNRSTTVTAIVCSQLQDTARVDEDTALNNVISTLRAQDHDIQSFTVSLLHFVKILMSPEQSQNNNDNPESMLRRLVDTTMILQDVLLAICPTPMLPQVLQLCVTIDILSHLSYQSDENIGEKLEGIRHASIVLSSKPYKLEHGQVCTKENSIASMDVLPVLHGSWFIGDGLLFCPRQLTQYIRHCSLRSLISQQHQNVLRLYDFAKDNASHSVAVRLLISACSIFLSRKSNGNNQSRLSDLGSDIATDELIGSLQNTMRSLAERSLGCSGIGMTNGRVDTKLALSALLSLPPKQAFSLYKYSLPIAMKTLDMARVVAITNIGCVVGGTANVIVLRETYNLYWKANSSFGQQCAELSTKAICWTLLQLYRINFDPAKFGKHSGNSENSAGHVVRTSETYYDAAMLHPLTKALYRSAPLQSPLAILSDYSHCFNIPLATAVKEIVLGFMSMLNSPMELMGNQSVGTPLNDDSNMIKALVKCSLEVVQDRYQRQRLLQECLARLRGNSDYSTSYEVLTFLLHMYCYCLATIEGNDVCAELDLAHRQLDCLSILTDFFSGSRRRHRPSIRAIFRPQSVEQRSLSKDDNVVPVLGSGRSGTNIFDPLDALDAYFRDCVDWSAATALAPLCSAMSIPTGYIYVRMLLVRFESALKNKQSTLPSFEADVLPTINRLNSAHDKALVAEWCAVRYGNGKDALSCYELALQSYIEVSCNAEKRLDQSALSSQIGPKNESIDKLQRVYETSIDCVKRITKLKLSLADIVAVKDIMLYKIEAFESKHYASVLKQLCLDIVTHLALDKSTDENIRYILVHGSDVIAKACTSVETSLALAQCQLLLKILGRVCSTLTDSHSHVHPQRIINQIVRQWLYHGSDEEHDQGPARLPSDESSDLAETAAKTSTKEIMEDIDDFNLDMSSIHNYSTDADSNSQKLHTESAHFRIAMEEEKLVLSQWSFKEKIDYSCQRVSLQIAFLMTISCNLAYQEVNDNKENVTSDSRMKRGSALSKLGSKRDTRSTISLSLARRLLRIAFAGSSLQAGVISEEGVNENGENSDESGANVVTFAMRYRALKAVFIMCTQDDIMRVIAENNFVLSAVEDLGTNATFLSDCVFGSYLAKEVEEMSLPIPHTNLVHLGRMNFQSYSRTLWRYHRTHSSPTQRARLMLLLLNLSVKNVQSVDKDFVRKILAEMEQVKLIRSLLLAHEMIVEYLLMPRVTANVEFPTVKFSLEMILGAATEEITALNSSTESTYDDNNRPLILGSLSVLLRVVKYWKLHRGETIDVDKLISALNSMPLHVRKAIHLPEQTVVMLRTMSSSTDVSL